LKQCLIFDNDKSFVIDHIYNLLSISCLYYATLFVCSSSILKVNLSNNIIGFVSVFLYSGAVSIVLILWKFDNIDTVLFFNIFYFIFDELLGSEEGVRVDLAKDS